MKKSIGNKFGFNMLLATTKMKRPSLLDSSGSVQFPFETFPWRLELKDVVCHFECKEHMIKYLNRYEFKPKDVKISNRYGEKYQYRCGKKKST